MLKRMNPGVWASIVVLLISLVFLSQCVQLSYTGQMGPGPGYFPIWLSGIMLVLSILYIFESLKENNTGGEPMPTAHALKNILSIIGCMVLFLVLVFYLGFTLTSTVFLYLLLYRAYKWYTTLAVSLGVSLLLFWAFGSLLGVALPVNGLGW